MENSELTMLLSRINNAVTDLTRSVSDRDSALRDITGIITKLQIVLENVKDDLEKIATLVDGNNGNGLKVRVVLLENEVKEIKGLRIAPSRLKEMLLGALITLLIGLGMYLIGKATGK